ncbi:MAG: hypothetical protein HYZ15_07805 [Sphingobacteriales bacterium]|nr:hypothetical protein [Sphingobacteriales bacterium]
MEYLLFAGYLFLFAWLVTRVKFFTRSGLSKSQLIIILLLKVLAGIFYGWIGIYYSGHARMWDTWNFHTNGLYEYHLLLNNPHDYFTNLFQTSYADGFSRFFESSDSYWNDLKGSFFIKLLSVFNIFSQGHYYVNVIFYSFFTLFGAMAIFRVMNDAFPGKRLTILLATFLIPSFLYWTSGIHKEGLIFTGIALCVYSIYFGNKEKRFSARKITALAAGLLLVLTLRNFLVVLLLPALLTWLLANRYPQKGKWIFGIAYLFFVFLFFTAKHLSSRLDFPQAVADKQQEFVKLKGKTTVPIRELEPTATGFLKNTPQAISLSMFRPYPGDVHHFLSLAASVEINLLLGLFLLFLWRRADGSRSGPLLYFCIYFSVSVLLAIGYSNNNIGAIVRYRSIIIPLLVIPMIAQTDWSFISRLIRNSIKKYNNI